MESQRNPKISFCEIFRLVGFSTLATVSANTGIRRKRDMERIHDIGYLRCYSPEGTLTRETYVEPLTTAGLPFRKFISFASLAFCRALNPFSGDQTSLVVAERTSDWLLQIVMHDLAEAEREVGKDMDG